jgi:hypothetical protein
MTNMKRLLTLVLVCASALSMGQDLPSWAYHSKITPKQRMEGMQKVLDMLGEDAKRSTRSKEALDHLEEYSTICEPLGQDGNGNPAFRVIAASGKKSDKKHAFFVLPLYSSESQAGSEIKEFLSGGQDAVVGVDGATLYINLDHLKAKNAVKMLAGAIMAGPAASSDKMQMWRRDKG